MQTVVRNLHGNIHIKKAIILAEKTFVLFCFILFSSCTETGNKKSDTLNDYLLINSAIAMSKNSRIEFLDNFSIALDSFAVRDTFNIRSLELRSLLDHAIEENLKAEEMARVANEIDSVLNYREQSLEMFQSFDHIYRNNFKAIITMMESKMNSKRDSIKLMLLPAYDTLKLKASNVTKTANLLSEKYHF